MDQMNGQQENGGSSAASTALGIVSLIVSILGGITFGVFGAAIALVCGIIAMVLAINIKKATNGEKGQAGFICGLLGIIFGAIFAVGCSVCGAGSAGYGCYGCLGASCVAAKEINDASGDVQELMDMLEDYQ